MCHVLQDMLIHYGVDFGHCLQRWASINPTMGQRLMFAGEFVNLNLKTHYLSQNTEHFLSRQNLL